MMKKIICLVLALIMAVMALTSCGGNEDAVSAITDEASRATTSLNMWLITESKLIEQASERYRTGWDPDNLTEAQEAEFKNWPAEERDALVQFGEISKAVNKLTKAKYKTKLNLVMMTEENYYGKLEEAYAAREAEIKIEQNSGKKEEVVGETVINEHGIPELKYPDASPNQVDIMFLGGFERYRDYADRGMLTGLDAHLQDTAIQLSYYINQIYIQATKYNGVISAIPNNGTMGEYTYLCVKDTELQKYGYDVAHFSELSIYNDTFYDFLSMVHQAQENGDADVYPIYTDAEDGKLDIGTVHYWNFDLTASGDCAINENEFSIFGSTYNNLNSKGGLTTRGDYLSCSNLLANETFMTDYLARKVEYENDGYVTTDPDAKAAACVVTGGWELQQEYAEKGYRVLMMKNPRATTTGVFDSMFAVGGIAADHTRAMEIITYLNTDIEFRNLLQYGVENVNYTRNIVIKEKDGMDVEHYYVTETETNLYKMDVNKTGNVFIAYPTTEEGIEELEYGKMQNLDATMYPTLGLYFDLKTHKLDTQSIRVINAITPYVEAKLNTLTKADDVRKEYDKFKTNAAEAIMTFIGDVEVTYVDDKGETKVVTFEVLRAALNAYAKPFEEAAGVEQSPYGLYNNWLTIGGYNTSK